MAEAEREEKGEGEKQKEEEEDLMRQPFVFTTLLLLLSSLFPANAHMCICLPHLYHSALLLLL